MLEDLNYFFKNAWRWKCGLPEKPEWGNVPRSIDSTERCDEFYEFMCNRLQMGAFRYGLLGDKSKNYDRLGSVNSRLNEYRRTKNKENLIDIANMCLLEYVEGNGHWSPTDDGQHTKEKI